VEDEAPERQLGNFLSYCKAEVRFLNVEHSEMKLPRSGGGMATKFATSML
jgi:hypothetical protein